MHSVAKDFLLIFLSHFHFTRKTTDNEKRCENATNVIEIIIITQKDVHLLSVSNSFENYHRAFLTKPFC